MKSNKWKRIITLSTLCGATCIAPISLIVSCNSNTQQETISPPSGNEEKPPIQANQMYGLNLMQQPNPMTGHKQTNDYVNLDDVNSTITPLFKQTLNNSNIQEYMNTWANWFANRFIGDRQATCIVSNKNVNITLNPDKTISGSISFEFSWNQEMYASVIALQRRPGEKELHVFNFDHAPINAYTNTAFTNFISFSIPSNLYQVKYSSNNADNSYNVGFKDSKINLDCVKDIVLDINNSSFNMNLTDYVENNMRSYQLANADTKQLIKEIVSAIASGNYNILIGGKDPVRNNFSLTSPYIKIKVSKNYTVDQQLSKTICDELSCLHYAISHGKFISIINGYCYISCWDAAFKNYKPNTLENLDQPGTLNSQQVLQFYNPTDLYNSVVQIKDKLISNNKNNVDKPWLEFINMSDTDKAKFIYKALLPYVSYGGMSYPYSGTNQGYIYGKAICDGYAHLFSYIGITLNIPALYVTGHVASNAQPGQTADAGMHAWNLIKNNDTWLWCDPTWDDSIQSNVPNYIETNFLKPSNIFFTSSTHLDVVNWNSGALLPINYRD